METIGIWLASLLTICILTFLYKDNPLYKFAEHLFVGISAAYWAAYSFHNILRPNLIQPLFIEGDLRFVVALALGIMMLMRLAPRAGWLSRWPLAFIVGTYSGYYFITYLQTNAVEQVRATLIPFVQVVSWRVFFRDPGLMTFLNAIAVPVMVIGVITGIIYFFFSREHKGVFGGLAKTGIWFLMVAFGASFGYTVMARISLLIGRMLFILRDWLGVIS
ncbi:hypothetical protein AMJ40_06360 [candidate division TA06 bacterium DG_26]|uniref:Uncharacterized protein n=1 Tax=candidate division TA06 bacterium DG_26 TaxID=1703771 RepID=A0A0S7WFW1_UNCT6|nr:MAG: hypothetical protein AMJ40_06360 [candidate division TA06 bacterium DG_26]